MSQYNKLNGRDLWTRYRNARGSQHILETAAAIVTRCEYPEREDGPPISPNAIERWLNSFNATPERPTNLLGNVFGQRAKWSAKGGQLIALVGKEETEYSLKDIHEKTQHPEHRNAPCPILAMVASWLREQPISEVKPTSNEYGILPLGLAGPTRRTSIRRAGLVEQEPAPLEQPSPIITSLPLPLTTKIDRGRHGRGAPPAQRLLFQAVASIPQAIRDRGPFLVLSTLRYLFHCSFAGEANRRRGIQLIREALFELEKPEYYVRHGNLDYRIVTADQKPTAHTRMDEMIPLRVSFPPDSTRGPLINRLVLRKLGAQSAPQFRAYIRLAYLWDVAKLRNGGRRVYATRPSVKRDKKGHLLDAQDKVILGGLPRQVKGKWVFPDGQQPQNRWDHPLAVVTGEERHPCADLVPALAPKHLVHLYYDHDKTDRNAYDCRLYRARRAATKMEDKGYVVVEEIDSHKRRLLEPWPIKDVESPSG